MKTTKRYYHDGDGIIREVITTETKTLKEKNKKNESKQIQDKPKSS